MKILITGHTGFLGRNIALHLSAQGHKIIGLSRNCIEEPSFNSQISCDLTDIQSYESLDGNKDLDGIEVVIHAASVLANNKNRTSFELLYTNLSIVENAVKLFQMIQPNVIINFSSFAVYPNIDGEFSEESEQSVGQNPEGLYGLSKICAENIFDFYFSNSTHLTNLRLGQVYGEGMRKDRIYSIFLQELIDTNKITVWGNGERTSNFIRISKFLDILQLFVDNKISGTFNVGEHNLSYKDIAQMIIDKYGNHNSKIILVPEGNRSKFILNLDKIRDLEGSLKKNN